MIDIKQYSGLGAAVENANEQVVGKIVEVDIKKLQVNKNNFYDEDYEIESLAEQIKINGQLEPILITEDYTILSGHRRYKAMKLLTMDKVLCRIVKNTTALSEEDELLTIIQANSYRTKTAEEVKEEVRLLKEIYQRKVDLGEITKSQVSKLISEASGKSQRQVQRIVKELVSPTKEKNNGKKQTEKLPEIINMENHLREKFDTQVKIKGNTRGKVTISYESLSHLQDIIDLMNANYD